MVKVVISKGDAYEATVKALELTNFKELVRGKSRVVIKPNLTIATTEESIITDVNVVRAILDQISKPEKVIIAEGSSALVESDEAFKVNDYFELEKEYGVELIDVNNDEYVEVTVDKPLALKSIKISKTVLNSDFLVSVGKLKIHSIATVTGALKNMMGVCTRQQKLEIHTFIPNSLVDLISVLMPDFGIIDGIVANEIDECVPHPIKMGIVLASKDCVALDSIASEIMGIHPHDVPYIRKIINKKLSIADLDEIEIIGERVQDIKKNFQRESFNVRSKGQRFAALMLIKLRLFNLFYRWAYRIFR